MRSQGSFKKRRFHLREKDGEKSAGHGCFKGNVGKSLGGERDINLGREGGGVIRGEEQKKVTDMLNLFSPGWGRAVGDGGQSRTRRLGRKRKGGQNALVA